MSSVVDEIISLLKQHGLKVDKRNVIKATFKELPIKMVIAIQPNAIRLTIEKPEDLYDQLESIFDEYEDADSFRDFVEEVLDEVTDLESKIMVLAKSKGLDVESYIDEELDEIKDMVEELIEEREGG